jgi:hypothetical protein
VEVTRKIVFNGREYASVDEMPPDVRKAYDEAMQLFADADHDGIPDIVQKHGVGIHTTRVELKGGIEDLPGALKASFQIGGSRPITFGPLLVITILLGIIAVLLALLLMRPHH